MIISIEDVDNNKWGAVIWKVLIELLNLLFLNKSFDVIRLRYFRIVQSFCKRQILLKFELKV